MGGSEQTQQFARLFMVPGLAHCGGGAGANAADYLAYLERWVEHNQPPDVLIATHIDSKNLADYIKQPEPPLVKGQFTRPIFPYPVGTQYQGSGDPNSYKSFIPVPLQQR
jgi:feruloyl esterase